MIDRTSVARAAWLTAVWGVSLVFYFRWWGVTLRVPGLADWAAAYTGLYAGTALLGLGREWLGTR